MKQGIEAIIRCSVCGQKYPEGKVQMISSREGLSLLHMSCSKCATSSLAITSRNNPQRKLSSVGVLTDLNLSEARELLNQAPINADEVLEVHQALETGAYLVQQAV